MKIQHVNSRLDEPAIYRRGAQARIDNEPFDVTRHESWQQGWKDMDKELQSHPDFSYGSFRAS
jgi:hypothetical protein